MKMRKLLFCIFIAEVIMSCHFIDRVEGINEKIVNKRWKPLWLHHRPRSFWRANGKHWLVIELYRQRDLKLALLQASEHAKTIVSADRSFERTAREDYSKIFLSDVYYSSKPKNQERIRLYDVYALFEIRAERKTAMESPSL